METIAEKIKDVKYYFKNKILNGDFVVTKIESHALTLLIEKEYRFDIWIGNFDIPNSIDFYNGGCNFIAIDTTQKERLKIRSRIKSHVIDFRNGQAKIEKEKEILRLQKELQELNKNK